MHIYLFQNFNGFDEIINTDNTCDNIKATVLVWQCWIHIPAKRKEATVNMQVYRRIQSRLSLTVFVSHLQVPRFIVCKLIVGHQF